jgi:hypothetical protein
MMLRRLDAQGLRVEQFSQAQERLQSNAWSRLLDQISARPRFQHPRGHRDTKTIVEFHDQRV